MVSEFSKVTRHFRQELNSEKLLLAVAGATKEEITETLLIAVVETGSTQLTWAKQIYSDYLGNNGHK